MLVYVGIFILTFAGGVLSDHRSCKRCKTPEPSCPKHEHYTYDNPRCIRTCANKRVPISDDCEPFTGCVCDRGYVRRNDNASGPCVPEDKCQPSCPNHEHYTYDNPRCIRTCANKRVPISDDCKHFTGCVCDRGYVRRNDDASGPCVPEDKCQKKCKDPNAVYVKCPNPCPLSCEHPFPRICKKACKEFGCQCASGFILDFDDSLGKCIKPEHCPESICCPKTERYVMNDSQCPKTCGNRLLPNSDEAGACAPFTGCACKPGYVRKYDNATGPCVKERKCPPIPTCCGDNEVPTSCATICPPQTCDSIFSKYYCHPTECKPGCDCLNGFLRNKDDVCIPAEDCFKPDPIECNGPNEVYSDCAITCPRQTCESLYKTYDCSHSNAATCAPGCNCLDGYLRNSLGICIPSEECCDDPAGCDGDLNATRVRGCGTDNPPTCENPEPEDCNVCKLNACECKPGYIVSCDDGDCIATKDCPGGSPNCGTNKTYVVCKFDCPTNYCPTDDSRVQVACSPPYVCKGGCACKAGYLIVSPEDPRCVLASDCPKVKCTRQNEVWDPNPSSCFPERCGDKDSECDHPYPPGPRCVCKEGFCRNDSDICVPAFGSPTGLCGDNATFVICPNPCPKTCDDPTAGDNGCEKLCIHKGCQCKTGYFMTKDGSGICIRPEDCESCKGDPNAVHSECPSNCPATCDNPDRNQACTKDCKGPGCVCREGFVLNTETGKCVELEDCPCCNGDPNAVYSYCPTDCEPSCDNPNPKICTLQCLKPGCVCRKGFVRNKETGKCVKLENCPDDFGCRGDMNATYKKCASPCPLTCDDQDPNRVCKHICKPGCECNPGYVLTFDGEGGICILTKDCPGCNGDPNAVYSYCPTDCEPSCDNPNPEICTLQCLEPGCVCRKGFVRNKETGKCVKLEHCPDDFGCRGDMNATYKKCASPCPLTCDDQDPNRVCKHICKPGCECNPGYVLTFDGEGGICILPKDCPGCKGDPHAVYSQCPSNCPATCDNPDRNQACTEDCKRPGCVCREDFVLNTETGKCVELEDCPSCNGDPNAVYSYCPTDCEPSCDNPNPEICTLRCLEPGCVCRKGFVRNKETGKCVKLENCPDDFGCKGDMNATYKKCASPCPLTCDDQDPNRVCKHICKPGCECNPGYVLTFDGEGGICILPKDCPGCKGDPHAVYSQCPSNCPATCDNPDRNQACTEDCKRPGCVCREDFVLNTETGKCVELEDCPSCNGDPNAVYSYCPTDCEPSCDNPNPEICTLRCLEPGCVCRKGFVRNKETGKCVKLENCPDDFGCKGDMNATYKKCASPCPLTCDDQDPNRVCKHICKPGCECNPGYVLTFDGEGGICILPKDCPGCNGDPNAVYSYCPTDCEPSCDNPNPEICNLQCLEPGCVCRKGFVRNKETGKCVKLEHCPDDFGCKGDMNATYKKCASPCPLTCDDQDPNRVCKHICKPGCECNPGYVLTFDGEGGICILPKDCPGCNGDPNAVYSYCPTDCEPSCDNPNPEICNLQCLEPGCVCRKGFVRNKETGKCVKLEHCPDDFGCRGDMNATYKKCASPCPLTCDDQDPNRVCKHICKPGCECNPGYVLTFDGEGGICILPKDCPGCKGDPHAVYSQCPSNCPATCDNPDRNQTCTEDCKRPGCVCREDFVLNTETGKCVELEDCPSCNGDPNAVYSYCPTDCEPSCDNPNPKICTLQCLKPGCVCRKGFVRNKETGKCVKLENCPDDFGCRGDMNATYKECASPCPLTCEDQDPKRVCKHICKPGCECNPGYVLTFEGVGGVCILPKDCPGCNGDPNAVYSYCPTDCEPSCDNPNPEICTLQCLEPGCVCRKGFVRNKETGKCVKLEHCPDDFGCRGDMNATYKKCASPCPLTCNDQDPNRVCKHICKPGCECNPGYVLTFDGEGGICILPKDCPGCKGDPHAVYSQCPSNCPATCDNPDRNQTCTDDCKRPGCVCREDFVLNAETGKCVELEDCPSCNGDPNAVYSYCPTDCEPSCDNPNPKICTLQCLKPGCVCRKGFVRNKETGKCVKLENCPDDFGCRGDMNATYKECASPCPLTCDDQDPNRVCKHICKPGCECNPGYVLTFDGEGGICILPKDCPGCKGDPHAVYSQCPSNCPATCDNPDRNQACTEDCKRPGCVCREDFVLNTETGKCVELEDCPSCNGDPNAVYSYCPTDCEPSCDNPNPKICTLQCLKPGCVCRKGFVRNKETGKCVKLENCPDDFGCRGDMNATYKECASPCPLTCDDQDPNRVCKHICKPGCECNPGYVLTFDGEGGICILPKDCPGCKGDPHAVYSQCPSNCPATCDNPDRNQACTEDCKRPGCVCREDFVLNTETGKCVELEDCPSCNGDPNAVYSYCPTDCEPSCDNPNPKICTLQCLKPGCVCRKGFVRNKETGKCVKLENCPDDFGCRGDMNATYKECASPCPLTCDDQDPNRVCKHICKPGCECNPGYVLTIDGEGGICILPKDCPGCKGDPHAVYSQCPSNCPATCDNPDRNQACTEDCKRPGCVCREDFVLNTETGKCVELQDCPSCNGDPNAVYSYCPTDCEPSCDNPNPKICTLQCLKPGCVCRKGFVRNKETGKCVKLEHCPDDFGCRGDMNATYKKCASPCPLTCDDQDPNRVCKHICKPGCECNPGYVLTFDGEGGICILPKDCPGCKGDPHAVYSQCPSNCPATCDNPDRNQACIEDCKRSGCVCREDFVLNTETGKCVELEDCPSCNGDPNAVYSNCPTDCEPSCDNPNPKICTLQCLKPGCVCRKGFVRNKETGKCVKLENCPEDFGCRGDMNATYKECASPCPLTCEDQDPKRVCPHICKPGCECNPGYVLTFEGDGGVCILPKDCPGCNGDPNAVYSYCPTDCEPSCDNTNPEICTLQCLEPGCVCRKGFVRNKETGKCVKLEHCPDDFGCRGDMNATYKKCASPCPLTCDDQDPNRVCKHICKPGCECNPGYVLTFDGEGGICILPKDCPGCKGDPHAVYSQCPSNCPATCDNPDRNQACTEDCKRPGCVCREDFVLNTETGKCVELEDCPSCNGDPNAVYSYCPTDCEPSCDNPNPKICTLQCLKPGCVCRKGFVRNKETGKCVKLENCPDDFGCRGDMNATYKKCASPCPLTCDDQDPNRVCKHICKPGCECNPGYVLTFDGEGGICILPKDCPGCKGDPHAVYSQCPSNCPATCDNPDRNQACTEDCKRPGCVCREDFVLNTETGKCVELEDCPSCNGDPNAVYSYCPTDCEPSCDNPNPEICTLRCLEPGCVCRKGFVRNKETGKCVKLENCPGDFGCRGDMNATYKKCASPCPLTCDDQDPKRVCPHICKPGCECNLGYVLTFEGDGGICILPKDCPDDCGCKGDMNATYSECASPCPTTCANRRKKGDMMCPTVCVPGCMCKLGYILNEEGICILPEDCPDEGCGGDPNAEYNNCTSTCPATCENPDPDQPCTKDCGKPGCVCKRGFVKFNGKCIKPEACPDCGPNAMYSECPSTCLATCDDPYPTCTKGCGSPGCVCIPGFVWARGKCIKLENCPGFSHCGVDSNATYNKCPSCYQPTCKNPDPDDCLCKDLCAPAGCVCKEGFLKKNMGGLCIRPEDCPGGWPTCRENETYVYCKVGCLDNYCPVDDRLDLVVCDPMFPCPGGCACKGGHLMVSEDDERCILSAECPPVKCTRPNEYWDPYAPGCLNERCDDRHIPCDFPYPGRPRCRCIEGYFRNENNICVPECECPKPKCGYNEVAVHCRQICPPQNCDIAYTDYACTEESKKCEPGCDCLPDHLRNDTGICIPNDQCPPPPVPEPICGYNEVAVPCRQICPPQNCEIAYTEYACTEKHRICEPGCDCLPDHLRNGSGICIPNDKCPYPSTPVCGINEIAKDCKRICPPQTCLSKYALILCPEDIPCESGCDCVANYLRDDRGICIPSDQCSEPCQIPDKCKRTCAEPNPPNCVYNPPKYNMDGCDCKEGYILSYIGGDCIPIHECPPHLACHGDPNSRPKRCPKPCPSTCEAPDQKLCKKMCQPIACECKDNYILSNNTECGRCILPDNCPGGNPCGKGSHFVDCKRECLRDYCPIDDRRDQSCDPPEDDDCLSGCICDLNHKRKSRKEPRCIVSSKCPPVNCTRPNEKWSSCPSACLAENCEDVNNQPTVCNTLVLNCEPRCICRKNHFRNASGICIPAKDCPPVCKDPNAVYKECTSACEPTCANPKPEICTDECRPARCVCKKGYVLNEKTGICVLPCECPDC